MSTAFAFDAVVVALVVAATLAGMARAARRGGRRHALLIALQPVAAILLLAALSLRDPPAAGHLVVLTPGADVASLEAARAGARVALPGAPAGEGIERVPDLATALRSHPADSLHVVGEGLRRHDRDAVGERAVSFTPARASDAAALVELVAPARVRAGAWWSVRGRVHAAQDATVVLLDPAGAKIAAATPDADGNFRLAALARAEGRVMHEVRLQRGDEVLQSMPVPVVATSAPSVRALLLAASPSPELKYLRRWALDAGVELEARIALAPGFGQRRGTAALDAARLADIDLLIVDERSWPQLASSQPVLRDAVAGGLGLLVRVTGPVPERTVREWEAWGIDAVTAARPVEVRLPAAPQVLLHAWPVAAGDESGEKSAQAARGTSPVPADTLDAPATVTAKVALLAAADGKPIAEWHALGRGRVGAWRLADSHRLYTRGERERHATLWSDAWSALARPRGAAIDTPARAVAGERAVACGLAPGAFIATPDAGRIALAVDAGCAAAWPRAAGWHRVVSGDAVEPFFVYAPEQLESLRGHERRGATQALVKPASTRATVAGFDAQRRRALLLAAWLGVMAWLWWLERRARRR